jgi:YebC/PmpR family DNA-binding regulatory protein
MSGHSKWSTIKHKKGAADARRSKVFTKLIKEITVAARIGGADASGNPRLRKALAEARANNMPSDNVERAIKKGTGELEGQAFEDIVYEAYGPGGVAVLIELTTDNRNRTVAEIRHMLEKHGAKMATSGAVSRLFHKRGVVVLDAGLAGEDRVMELGLDLGADDVRPSGGGFEVLVEPGGLEAVRAGFEKAGLVPSSAEIAAIPETFVRLEGHAAETMLKLMAALEDHEDVQKVWANFDIDDDVMERFSA